ncbi:NADPH-dependent 1-acyldihydroxyacetone phosphate reductase [Trichomonascus vanleenenianus]|uniref:acylglycerone-phosphate reductase n=1 Tax=Trichomonascus vanleenenianus TaxID=2268995 RepID=UPI003ECA889C
MPEGKVALITGCSSGIGKDLAKEFHKHGWTVYAGARRLALMSDLAELGIHTVELDVTSQESIDATKKAIEADWEKLDLLYNNAGQSCTFPVTDLAPEVVQQCFDVNLFGVIKLVQAFTPMLIKAKGTIANTGSVAALEQFPFSAAYGASKAALHQLMNTLRLEMAPFGVKVTTVCTAAVKTEIADTRGLPENSLYAEIEDGVALRRTMAAKNSPMTTAQYAVKVYGEVTKRDPKPLFWEGGNWFMLWVIYYFVPRRIVDFFLSKRFKLDRLADIVQARKAKSD